MQTNRKRFSELLQRYIDGTCSAEEKQMMDCWYDLLDAETDETDSHPSQQTQEEEMWQTIQQRIHSKKATRKPALSLKWRRHEE